ncbi:hypothetical protein LX32DRAFT_643644 [Colletotrichum zoysiae]|uniref:Uncharacterized protein n=1 Tax=Colletotrichum zoysiae TaxID=1216348 RepID=A0AAD9HAL6_9PEZI|nr:hypothetical protein LX32DRAFT_643644 [Colletotrichum zoysiae]
MYVASTHVQVGDFRCPTALPSAGGRWMIASTLPRLVGWLAGWHDRVSPLILRSSSTSGKQNKRDRSVRHETYERGREERVRSDALVVSGVPQLSAESLLEEDCRMATCPASTDRPRPRQFHSLFSGPAFCNIPLGPHATAWSQVAARSMPVCRYVVVGR